MNIYGELECMKKNNKLSLEDQICHEIKMAILNRKIGPNTHLSEEQLAEVFNVSRTPIRHVLKRLQYEKIIQILPNRGAFIYEPTLKEIEEVFHLRTVLEVEAVRLACRTATEAQLEKLEELTYLEEELYKQGEYAKILPVTNQVHLGIVELSGSELMLNYCKGLCSLSDVYLAFYDHVTESPFGPSEHRKIIQYIRERNVEEAQKHFLDHFSTVKEHLIYQNHKEQSIDLRSIFKPVK
jgi:DNA-binding GntR family transcriptional regulator